MVKKYEHHTDLFVNIKDSILDAFLNCENSYKDLIQVCVEMKSQRISDRNEVRNDTFHVLTKRIQRNRSDVRDEFVQNLHKNITNHQQQGNGWVITGLGNVHVDNFVKTRSMKTYDIYVKWPVAVSGRERIVNIRTERDCVHQSMVANFCYKNALRMHDLSRQARFF